MKLKLFIATLLYPIMLSAQSTPKKSYYLTIGTYTKSQNNGLFVYQFNTKTGKLKYISSTEGITNPSYLTFNHNATKVYSVSEAAEKKSSISAFDFDNATGKLSFVNSELTNSGGPCYITIAKDEKFVFTANYGGGSISVFPIDENGQLKPNSQLINHKGSSINKSRQSSPHAHSVRFSPDNKILYAADLGTDKLYAYNYNSQLKQPLIAKKEADIQIEAGDGPRHFEFNAKGNKLYVLGEMEAQISVFTYEANKSELIQKISLNNSDFTGTNGAADIHLSKDGRFLYATNRGTANEIVVFKVDRSNGKLTKISAVSSMGKTPRNFVIDPSDKFLLVANQNSDDIYVFKRNKKTGNLTYHQKMIKVGAPVCLKFSPLPIP